MANAAAVIPLDYGGTDLQTDPIGWLFEIKRGLNEPAEVRGIDLVISHLAGQVSGSREGHRRLIELRGPVMGQGADEATQRADFADMRETLRALFDPKVTRVLTATLENGATATINAKTLNAAWIEVTPTWFNVSIELESLDPDWVITPAGS